MNPVLINEEELRNLSAWIDEMSSSEEDSEDEDESESERSESSITSVSSTMAMTPVDDDDSLWQASVVENEPVVPQICTSSCKKPNPYHVIVNSDFQVLENSSEAQMIGQQLGDIITIIEPSNAQWTWKWLRSWGEKPFQVTPASSKYGPMGFKYKATVLHASDHIFEAILRIVPDDERTKPSRAPKKQINFMTPKVSKPTYTQQYPGKPSLLPPTLLTLPIPSPVKAQKNQQTKSSSSSSSSRQASELRPLAQSSRARAQELTSKHTDAAMEIQRLKEELRKEKALLESLVPRHVAQGLRTGENVKPRLHEQVTFFFSDVVGFTDMCKQVYPWEVCAMLNRLYCVMDHFAAKFNLFKVETIGDAYVCCSGLPDADPRHAEKVANFAVAVSQCTQQVVSPVDGSPIKVRIGVHTGSAASGVVGVTNPRYCVFGDTVNVTARHEGTGEAGRVHCSAVTQRALVESGAIKNFDLTERGLIDMKGKGKLRTFWCEASERNPLTGGERLLMLEAETEDLLNQTKFDNAMEREASEKTGILAGKLGTASFSGANKEVMGPILDIIRGEISRRSESWSKNGSTCGSRSLLSQHSKSSCDSFAEDKAMLPAS